jgi:thiaminase
VDSYTYRRDEAQYQWCVQQPVQSAIRLNSAARHYVSFEAAMMNDYVEVPYYYALANYPCFKLWPEMCKYLKENMIDWNKSVYKKWIEDNSDDDKAGKEAAATKLARVIDWCIQSDGPKFKAKIAEQVLIDALNYEVDFFNSAKIETPPSCPY